MAKGFVRVIYSMAALEVVTLEVVTLVVVTLVGAFDVEEGHICAILSVYLLT